MPSPSVGQTMAGYHGFTMPIIRLSPIQLDNVPGIQLNVRYSLAGDIITATVTGSGNASPGFSFSANVMPIFTDMNKMGGVPSARKMVSNDAIKIVGLILGILLLVGSLMISGDLTTDQPFCSAIMIVVGGVACAIMITYSFEKLKTALPKIKDAFVKVNIDWQADVDEKIIGLADIAAVKDCWLSMVRILTMLSCRRASNGHLWHGRGTGQIDFGCNRRKEKNRNR